MLSKIQVGLISPYHGGSHRAWATGLQAHSRHGVRLLTLPARFWKWRMHGGAVTLARRFRDQPVPDVLLVTDMLDLTTFLALTRALTATVPVALYMHENQLTYPLPADPERGPMRRQRGERDLHYAFVNYASMMAADLVLFNSDFHRRSLLAALPRFLNRFPEYKELGSVDGLAQRSRVLPVGIALDRLAPPLPPPTAAAPLILWNQRWEYDKNPAAFFRAVSWLADQGVPFRLALCGQRFGRQPPGLVAALERLADHIVHLGHAPPARYRELLWEAAVTVSTAHHEFFGISILEAVFCHTFPLLPRRLSYPELIPAPFHEACLYDSEAELQQRLRHAVTHPQETRRAAAALAPAAAAYDWSRRAPGYDEMLATLAGRPKSA